METDGVKFNLHQKQERKTRSSQMTEITSEMFPEATIPIPRYSPSKTPLAPETTQTITADIIKTDGLSEEELLFYSARGEMLKDSGS